jgi:SAM-dependent methyltransferase
MEFVCPQCKSELRNEEPGYACAACGLRFPVICGIPDFRLFADPYIDIAADRAKGEALEKATRGMSFTEAVRYYYSITPDDPADLAELWTARALVEVAIAREMLAYQSGEGPVLDVGCSTGAVLIAAGGGVGVDIAFRWLVLGALRLREAGVAGQLVCANAEYLPFAADMGARVTSFDTLEHLRDAPLALREMRRVGQSLLLTSNNRWAPVPEPHVHLWGVGWLPRGWQAGYVAWRRGDLHPYRIQLRGAQEGEALAREAGWTSGSTEAAPLYVPQMGALAQRVLTLYRAVRRWPGMRWLGPRWMLRA